MKFGLSEKIYDEIKNIVNKYNKYQFKIFGSRARGDYKANSDIDIAVFGHVSERDEFLFLFVLLGYFLLELFVHQLFLNQDA